MIKTIALAAIAALGALLIFAGTRPDTFSVQRTASIKAPPEKLHGPSPYVGKVMGLVFNMDSMMGRDFEAGLANLKARAERPA